MAATSANDQAIFEAARKIGSGEERDAFVRQMCAGDEAMAERVRALLRAYDESASFLESPARQVGATINMPGGITEDPGSVVGPYKLLQQIGEGGFGVVYMAEQTKPVRRKVALKIIKPGMDTKEVIARFEAERQALALMDHPNIARVLDAGATDSGRPYFVMELVKGVPVIEYCDKNHLPARDRLKLFVDVCHAIQHAHQKGVIHRDLKPSNIMVTLHDGKPVPKVIDFGVSKALSQQLTEKTLFTAYGQMVGTPAYMSPEQAEMSGLDIDTRSDVYSLGVLLYELLTGGTPFDSKRLREAGYAEMQRIIREEEPVRPSTRLTTLGDESTVVSRNRGTDPKKLGQLVRGELDWIVMKALDKERNRRYETANGFAADIERFLADEPVEACPPSAAYRFRKFARRNKAPMAVTGAAFAALLAVAIGSTIAAGNFRKLANRLEQALIAETDAKNTARDAQQEAEDARDREEDLRIEAEEQTEIARNALADARQQRDRAEANYLLARSSVDEFLNEVTENQLLSVPGLQPLREELLSDALNFYDKFIQDEANAGELQVELATAHYRVARIRLELGQQAEYRASMRTARRLFEQLRDDSDESLEVRLGLAKCYNYSGRVPDAVSLYEQILESHPQHAEARMQLAGAYNSLALGAEDDDDLAAALVYHRQAVALYEGLGEDFPDEPRHLAQLGATVNNLGNLLAEQSRHSEALAMYERAAAATADAFDREPENILWGRWLCIQLNNIAAKQLLDQNPDRDPDAALESLERVVSIRRKLVFENPRVPSLKGELYRSWIELSDQQRILGLAAEADRSLRAAEQILTNIGETPKELFELALIYGTLATPDDDAPDRSADADLQHYADLAMAALRRSVDAGHYDVESLESHSALAVLRERDEFRQLVTEVRALQLAAEEGASPEQTIAERRRGAETLRDLIGDDPTDVRHRKALAAALHSIGVMHGELQQFDEAEQSLKEALQLRQDLRRITGGELDVHVDELATRVALAELYWTVERYPEAHQLGQECLSELRQLAEEHPDDTALQRRLARDEHRLCDHYGFLGLWELASACSRTNAELGRVTHFNRCAWRSVSLLSVEQRDEFRNYGDVLHQEYLRSEAWLTAWPLASVAWTNTLLEDSAVTPETLVALSREALAAEPERPWFSMILAMALFRDDQFDEALAMLEQFPWGRGARAETRPRLWLSSTYLRAMLHLAQNRPDEAAADFAVAEQYYRQFCRETLERPSGPFPAPVNLHWWWLVYPQQLRREAWRKLHGDEPPDDPWQHLIQARGYRLIGDTERAEAELTAAATAAAGDPYVSFARLQLLEKWDEGRRVDWSEADWQRLVEHAKEDTAVWSARARWYAEQGQYDRAAADFDRGIDLLPGRDIHTNHPARRPIYWTAMQWEDVYERLVQLREDDQDLPFERGLYLAVEGEFDDALAAFRSGNLQSAPLRRRAQLAMLLLLNGEHEEYRRHCRNVQETWPNNVSFFRILVDAVGPDSGTDPQMFLTWSDRLWADGDGLRNKQRLSGACRFRAGDLDTARERLQCAYETQGHPDHDGLTFFLLAMVHHRLGDADQSRQWYDRGVAALEKWRNCEDPATELIPYVWLQLNVQFREAVALLGLSPDTIYVMNADGSERRPLFSLPGFPQLGSPAVSRDGRKIAFDGWQEGQDSRDGRVFVMNRDGSELIDLGEALMPTWSSDGKFVSVSRRSPDDGAWIMAIDGSTAEHLSDGWGAQWSPDGRMIAYTNGPQITIYDVATGNERGLFPPDFQPYQKIYHNMTWSPDSKRLCILGLQSGHQGDVATLTIEDPQGSLKVHHSGTRIYADFAWHPDGGRIVFPMYDTERSHFQLYEFNPDGDDPPKLVAGQNSNRTNTDVTWTPDGTELIFVSR